MEKYENYYILVHLFTIYLKKRVKNMSGKYFCPNCGAALEQGIRFCPNCGTTLTDREPPVQQQPVQQQPVQQPVQPPPAQVIVQQGPYQPYQQHVYGQVPVSPLSRIVTLILCIFFGCYGVHRFYSGSIGLGVLYFFTLGLLGIGPFIDFILILVGSYRDSNGRLITEW